MTTHQFPLRIYYEDTDAGGIVYHANYLKFAERARTEFIRDIGISNHDLKNDHNVLVVVRHMDIDYSTSAYLEDDLIVESAVTDIGRSSFTMTQIVKRDGLACATMIVKLVCIDKDSGRPVRIPEILKDKIKND